MKTKFNKIVLGSLALAALTLNSCKKEVPEVNNTLKTHEAKVAAFAVAAEKQQVANTFILKFGLTKLPQYIAGISKYMKNADGIIEGGMACATVTIDSSSSPRIATLDFGSGCTDSDGRNFSGSIVIRYTDTDMSIPGNAMNATFNSFTMDSLSLDGTFDLNCDSRNGAGNLFMTANINMTTNFVHDNFRITGSTTASVEVVPARNTIFLQISGSGTDHNGIDFTQTTTTRIEQSQLDNCTDHFVKGVLLIQSPSLPDEEIDYGNGDCDDLAVRTVNGISTQFTLEKF